MCLATPQQVPEYRSFSSEKAQAATAPVTIRMTLDGLTLKFNNLKTKSKILSLSWQSKTLKQCAPLESYPEDVRDLQTQTTICCFKG